VFLGYLKKETKGLPKHEIGSLAANFSTAMSVARTIPWIDPKH
jgi:hypothetical protein